ncbi:MAG TPA: hypothetical protein VI316_03880, partial [Candidatus Dormibacteraeota bacterium]
MNFSTQVHDFDADITPYPGGLFWTQRLPDDSVDVELDEGEARMAARNRPEHDFFNIPNALFRFQSPASVLARCSFDIRWSGPVTNRSKVNDPTIGFAGTFVLSHA